MGGARLNLLRERVDVAEAPLERTAGKDRVDARGLVGVIRDFDRARADEPNFRLGRIQPLRPEDFVISCTQDYSYL